MNTTVSIDTEKNTVVAHISGEISKQTADGLRSDIDFAVNRYLPQKLILDFDRVTFIDSFGVGLVMGRYKTMKDLNGCVVIENTKNPIKTAMRFAGLDRLVTIK